jgi:hypothetical protein
MDFEGLETIVMTVEAFERLETIVTETVEAFKRLETIVMEIVKAFEGVMH